MNKQVTLILIVIIFSFTRNCLGQKIKLTYSLTFSFDSTDLSKKYYENILVYSSNNVESISSSENFFRSDSLRRLISEGKLSANEKMGGKYEIISHFTFFVEKKIKEGKQEIYERLYTDFYKYEQALINNWELKNELKEIEGFLCRKALCHYRGRDYVAWYTEKIPVFDGPLFFSGLPGLIVQIADTKNHYVFILNGFQNFNGTIPEISFLSKLQPARREKVFELREYMRKDFLGYLKINYGIRLMDGDIETKSVIEGNAKKRNNPIELE